MKNKKIYILTVLLSIIIVAILLTSCEKNSKMDPGQDNIESDKSVENEESNFETENYDEDLAGDDIKSKENGSEIGSNDEKSTGNYGNFFFVIEDIFGITGRGVVVTGYISSGTISKADKVDLIDVNGKREVTVTDIERARELVDSAEEGELVGLLIYDDGLERDDIKSGELLVSKEATREVDAFFCEIESLPKEISEAIYDGNDDVELSFEFYGEEISGRIYFEEEATDTGAKESTQFKIKMSQKIFIKDGVSFEVFKKEKNIGSGVVTGIDK